MLLRLLLVVCALLPATVAAAAGPDTPLPSGMTLVTSAEGITQYRLANGLEVLMLPDDSKPTTTVNMTVKVGSRNENYGETGMAHLLEHMLFKGTVRHPGSIQGELSQRGLRFNGSTNYDRTNYFASMVENEANLDFYLRWLSDSLVNSTVLRRDLDSEMTVVRNEMESGENNPGTVLFQELLGVAYHWHNYGKATIGARVDVENVNIEHLQAFYHRYYQPDNAVLIVTGKFDVAKTLQIIASAFGPIPKPTRVLEPTYTLDPAQDGERSVTVRRVGDTPLILSAYHIPAGSDPEFAAAVLATSILGGNDFRLDRALVETGLAADAGGFAMSLKEPGIAVFEADLKSDQSIENAENALIAAVEKVGDAPFSADELERAKNAWQRSFEQTFNDPERVGIALSEYIALGDWRLMFLRRERIRAATLDEVNAFARRYFIRSNRSVGIFIPTADPVRAPAPHFVDVPALVKDFKGNAAVQAGEAFDIDPANIARRTDIGTLANGIHYALLAKRTRGAKVVLNIALHFGDEKSLFGKIDAGEAVPSMLPRGTVDMTREQLAAAFEKLQTSWSLTGGPEGATLSLSTTRPNLDAALKLALHVLRAPRFDAQEFEQMRTAWIADVESERSDPESRLAEKIDRYGNPYPAGDVRYARTLDEALAAIKGLSVAATRDFYSEFYGATNATITAVGDFDAATLKEALAAGLADWKSKTPWTRVPRPYVETGGTELKVIVKDKQNAVMLGSIDVPLRDSDREFQALSLATHIFGGGSDSRLWDRIRQKDGLSYGVNTGLSGGTFNANAGWELSAIFAPQNAGHVRSDFDEELARARRDGFTAEELTKAKAAIAQQVRLARAQDGALAGTLGVLIQRDQTPLYLEQIQKLRDSITLDEVNAAFRKYVVTDHLVIGTAGDLP